MTTGEPRPALPEWVKLCLVVVPLLGIFGIVLTLIVTSAFVELRRDLTADYAAYEVVEARVVRTEQRGAPSNATHMWVSYEVDGVRYADVWIGPSMGADSGYSGRSVELLHPPGDPEDVVVREYAEGVKLRLAISLFMATVFAVLLACMVGIGVQGLRQYRARRAAEAGETGEDPG